MPVKPRITPKVEHKQMPPVLPEPERSMALTLGLRDYEWTDRWAICWVERHGTHVVKKFDQFWQWVCLEHGVIWRTPAKVTKEDIVT